MSSVMTPRPIIVGLIFLMLPGVAASDEPAIPDAARIRNAISHLESDNRAQRAATYQACRGLGVDFRDTYRKMLERAKDQHARRFTATINDQLDPQTPAGKFADAWRAWEASSKPARESAQTHHAMDRSELGKLDRLFATAEGDWKTLRGRHEPKPGDPVATRISDAADALAEISRELAWCEDPEKSFDAPSLKDLEAEYALGTHASDYLAARNTFATAVAALKSAHEWNQRQDWADSKQKEFANILNERRAVLGLSPFRLNEILSTACRKHSEEMERLNYFSHDSPVEAHRTFVMRAKQAGFENPTGECLYKGESTAFAAEQAWWYSCGHRLINYTSGPDTLGLGIRGSYWTLNTGNAP